MPQRDNFKGAHTDPAALLAPATQHFIITPGAGDIPIMPRAIRFESAGSVTMEDQNGVAVTYTVAAGEVFEFRASKITASTVTQIVGWN